VPCYYAVLNLAKLIILFSDEHGELEEHRYHGLSYNPLANPASLVEDDVILQPKGVAPLLYRALTGHSPTQKKLKIETRDVYRLIPGCSYEWTIASGGASYLARLSFSTEDVDDEERLRVTVSSGFTEPPGLSELDALRNVVTVPDSPDTFQSVEDLGATASKQTLCVSAHYRSREKYKILLKDTMKYSLLS
jgi:hypothetical protein